MLFLVRDESPWNLGEDVARRRLSSQAGAACAGLSREMEGLIRLKRPFGEAVHSDEPPRPVHPLARRYPASPRLSTTARLALPRACSPPPDGRKRKHPHSAARGRGMAAVPSLKSN